MILFRINFPKTNEMSSKIGFYNNFLNKFFQNVHNTLKNNIFFFLPNNAKIEGVGGNDNNRGDMMMRTILLSFSN